ncbi:MAG: ribosomal-processing cysteine protease Prp [Treponema sp.]|jgi:uncharacterized protein YsxB (DUF464 family)|nr:ribosomal-processing cysteine protease Prp [Treponema sp.]MBQ7882038.1 ribosomal-processing cysteine protease Prp [Treponema sp.]
MVLVTLSTGKNGVLNECKANGHACFSKKGEDIVCSAVTILLRTVLEYLSQMENVTVIADTSSRGNLAFRVEVQKDSSVVDCQLKCMAEFIRIGIKSLSNEFPENVQLREY